MCVCGSVAAIDTPKIIRRLKKKGSEVRCVMSESAHEIINPNVLEWASEKPVITKLTGAVEHVKSCGVGGFADMLLICPATSNTISKIACGIDDTTVTTFAATALGAKKRIIIVPAMHISMYENPFVKENIRRLEKAGVVFMMPRIEDNKAKLPEVEDVVDFVTGNLA